MVTGNDYDMSAGGGRHPTEESIVQFLCSVAWCAGIKDIPGKEQGIYALGFYEPAKPVKKG